MRVSFRLTREVRFAINRDGRPDTPVTNSYAGYPTLVGFGQFFTLQVTLSGELDSSTQYLINIKRIDAVVREKAIDVVASAVRAEPQKTPPALLAALWGVLRDAWAGVKLDALKLCLSPFLSV
jgi:hypothetical protein